MCGVPANDRHAPHRCQEDPATVDEGGTAAGVSTGILRGVARCLSEG